MNMRRKLREQVLNILSLIIFNLFHLLKTTYSLSNKNKKLILNMLRVYIDDILDSYNKTDEYKFSLFPVQLQSKLFFLILYIESLN